MNYKKNTASIKGIPAAKTLRPGSYRMVSGPGRAYVVRHTVRKAGDNINLSDTDLLLLAIDSGWEKAEQAYYRGLDEGYIKGHTEGCKEVQSMTTTVEQTLASLDRSLLEFYAGLERWAVKLAMKIAEKVVGQAADENQELVHQTVRRAIAEAADKTRILIRVNPSDYEAMKEFRSSVTALSEGIEQFKIEADGSVTPGSCRVETASGFLDADFTTQLEQLRRTLILHEETKE